MTRISHPRRGRGPVVGESTLTRRTGWPHATSVPPTTIVHVTTAALSRVEDLESDVMNGWIWAASDRSEVESGANRLIGVPAPP
jgi:hypothetical protein